VRRSRGQGRSTSRWSWWGSTSPRGGVREGAEGAQLQARGIRGGARRRKLERAVCSPDTAAVAWFRNMGWAGTGMRLLQILVMWAAAMALVSGLLACDGVSAADRRAAETQTAVAVFATQTASLPPPTDTAQPTATQPPSITRRPTATRRPTFVPRPTATPRPTRTPQPTSTPRPTFTPR
jgi:hypothetical protein